MKDTMGGTLNRDKRKVSSLHFTKVANQ